MFTDVASHLTGTSVCSPTLLPILLAHLYVHWHCFQSYWHFCVFTDFSSHFTGNSVFSLTLLPILLALLYVHCHCFPSYWYFCEFTDISSHLADIYLYSLTPLPILLAILCVNWHYFPSYDLASLYSQNKNVRKRSFWHDWWHHDGKETLDKHFWYAAEAWTGCCLYACYDVFINVGCGGLHCTSGGNEVLPCVQVQFSAVSFLS